MTTSLDQLSIGSSAILERLEGDAFLTERLMDMGLCPGLEIEFFNRMVGGGPFVVRVQSVFLALREEEARCLKVRI